MWLAATHACGGWSLLSRKWEDILGANSGRECHYGQFRQYGQFRGVSAITGSFGAQLPFPFAAICVRAICGWAP